MTKKDRGANSAVRRWSGPRPVMRITRMFAVVGSVLCLNLFAALPAHADSYWTNAIEVPGLSTLNHTTAMTGTIVCTSKGNCVTGGSYTDSALNTQAYVATETAGVWSPAREVAAALNVGGVAAVYAFSCPSEGNCTASGTFADGDNIQHAFALNEVSGVWGSAVAIADYTTLQPGDQTLFQTISCAAMGTCVGIGAYLDEATNVGQPLIFTETNGVWSAPVLAPGFSPFNPSGIALVVTLSCPAAGSCDAGGIIVGNSASTLDSFLMHETNGVWGEPFEIPGITALGDGAITLLDSLSCGAPGDCSAGGLYSDKVGLEQAFVVSEVNGTWGDAVQLFGTTDLGSGLTNGLYGLSCSAKGECSGVGSYGDDANNDQGFVVSEVNGTWGSPIEVPGITSLNHNVGSDMTAISCNAPGSCTAGGTYINATSSNVDVFVTKQTSGTWSNAAPVPNSDRLNQGGKAAINNVSCSSDGSCGVNGTYTDAQSNTQIFVDDSSAVAPTNVSGAPRHVTAVDKRGVVTVRWSAPASTGGTPITSYAVTSVPKSKGCTTRSTSCALKGLSKKVHYSFQVRAINADGTSAASAKSNAVLPH